VRERGMPRDIKEADNDSTIESESTTAISSSG